MKEENREAYLVQSTIGGSSQGGGIGGSALSWLLQPWSSSRNLHVEGRNRGGKLKKPD